jgi:aryl-alcohol dehydrogenase-like predicted oxidoreductase
LQKALGLADKHGWEPFVSLQPCYNLLVREIEWELIPLCRKEGLDDNLGAAGWSLDPDQRARLDQASARPAPYPYSWVPD